MSQCTQVALLDVEGEPNCYDLRWKPGPEPRTEWGRQAIERDLKDRDLSECPHCRECVLKIKADNGVICVPVLIQQLPRCNPIVPAEVPARPTQQQVPVPPAQQQAPFPPVQEQVPFPPVQPQVPVPPVQEQVPVPAVPQ